MCSTRINVNYCVERLSTFIETYQVAMVCAEVTNCLHESAALPLSCSFVRRICMCVLLRNTCIVPSYPHTHASIFFVKHLLACFGNSSISHMKMTLPARPRGVHPNSSNRGAFTMCPGRFSPVSVVGGVAYRVRFGPFLLKNSPGAFGGAGRLP